MNCGPGISPGRNHTYFNIYISWKPFDSDRFACGEITCEEFTIHFIDYGKQRHITEENVCFYYVVETVTGSNKYGFKIFHYLNRFFRYIFCLNVAGNRIKGNLTGNKQDVTGLHSLAIRPDRRWCVVGCYNFFFHAANV